MATVTLKPKRAKPFFYKHPWIYSGAVERVDGDPQDGDVVDVLESEGKFIAKGFYSVRSQIRIRLLTWEPTDQVDEEFLRKRLLEAVELRKNYLKLDEQSTAYRLVYSEGDSLPGLIVDKFDEFFVVQFLCSGMDKHKETILDILQDLLSPRGIFERSDSDVRTKEGLTLTSGVLRGEEPPERLEIKENGLRFYVDIKHGQKTGFYLDQRENRLSALRFADGRKVLDCFCYTGGFSIYAGGLGRAKYVLGIDESERNLELARENASLNGVREVEFRAGNVFEELRYLRNSGQKFDMIILDPPKFARSKKEVESAKRGYKDINLLAMQCLEPGGILVTCSCSQHIDEAGFESVINSASVDVGRTVQIIERRTQASDHPVLSSCPETRYLKCLICRIF